MAEGSWVPAFDSLWRHRKTEKLVKSDLPAQRRHAMAGLWLEVCAWARDACESGDLGSVSPGTIAKAVGLPEARGEQLIRALIDAELVSPDGRHHVVGWEEGAGRIVEKRKKEREKKKRQRGGTTRAEGADRSSTGRFLPVSPGTGESGPPGPSARVPRDVPRDRADVSPGRREEKRVEVPPYPLAGTRDAGAAPASVEAGVRVELVLATAGEPWRTVLERLLGDLGRTNFLTWFEHARFEQRDGRVLVRVPNAFAADWIERKYSGKLRQVLEAEVGAVSAVRVLVEGAGDDVAVDDEPPVEDPR